MLKIAMYINVFLFFILSIIFLVIVFNKNVELKKLRQIIIIYMIYNFTNFVLFFSGIVDISWDFLYLFPISLISYVVYIICLCLIDKRIKKIDDVNYTNLNLKKYIFMIIVIIPILIFVVPYMYELYIINNCNYLLKYNYQNGIVVSDDTYIAIFNDKPISITLQNNIFFRKGKEVKALYYDISYSDTVEISESSYGYDKTVIKNEDFERIALDAKERCQFAKSALLSYFPEKKYSIISLLSHDGGIGNVLGEYFYYNSMYVQSISTYGGLETIIYYE